MSFLDAFAEEWIGGKVGVFGDDARCFGAGGFYHFYIFDRFHAEVGDAPLLATAELARPAEHKVKLGEFKTALCGRERFEALERSVV